MKKIQETKREIEEVKKKLEEDDKIIESGYKYVEFEVESKSVHFQLDELISTR